MSGIISRAEAMARGLKRYFTGRACPRGHTAQRWTCSCVCIGCSPIVQQRYRAENLDRSRHRARNYYAALSPEQKRRVIVKVNEWSSKNQDMARGYKRKSALKNIEENRSRKRLLERERNFWCKQFGILRLAYVPPRYRKAIQEIIALQITLTDFQRSSK